MSDSLGLAVLSRVSPVDRLPFMHALVDLSSSDQVQFDEDKTVAACAEAWDMDTTGRKKVRGMLRNSEPASLAERIEAFEDSNTPFLLLQELVRVSVHDDSYAKIDRETVERIADRLGFSSTVLDEIEMWVERSTVWGNTDMDEHTEDALSEVLNREDDGSDYDLSDIPTTDPEEMDRASGKEEASGDESENE